MGSRTVALHSLEDPRVVYREVLPDVIRAWQEEGNRLCLTWDFTELELKRINSQALCLFLALADSIRESAAKVDSKFRWDPMLNEFLQNCNFLPIVRARKLFGLDEGYLGGASEKPFRKGNRIFAFSPRFDASNPIYQHTYHEIRNIKDQVANDEVPDKLADQFSMLKENANDEVGCVMPTICELCANAMLHSQGVLYGFAQVTGKKLSISIVDNGIGLKQGLLHAYRVKGEPYSRKFWWHSWEQFRGLAGYRAALASIVEATIRNSDKCTPEGQIFGLWQLLRLVLPKPRAIANVHTANVLLSFSSEVLEIIEEAMSSHDVTAYNELVYRLRHKISRFGSAFPGCQIDIQYEIDQRKGD